MLKRIIETGYLPPAFCAAAKSWVLTRKPAANRLHTSAATPYNRRRWLKDDADLFSICMPNCFDASLTRRSVEKALSPMQREFHTMTDDAQFRSATSRCCAEGCDRRPRDACGQTESVRNGADRRDAHAGREDRLEPVRRRSVRDQRSVRGGRNDRDTRSRSAAGQGQRARRCLW